MMIPLQFYFLAHPDSKPSMTLAEKLMQRFMDPPANGGLRVPVRLTPDQGDGLPPAWDTTDGVSLNSAAHSVVVVFFDSVMLQTVNGGTAAQWKAFFADGLQQIEDGDRSHRILAVAVGNDGFNAVEDRHILSVNEPPWDNDKDIENWADQQIAELTLQVTLSTIDLLDPAIKSQSGRKPLRLFLSHAKADLERRQENPVEAIQTAIHHLPVSSWFDAAEIPPSSRFEDEISQGVRDSSIVVSILTDRYASRPWCQREILDAKRLDLPFLTVVALEKGEPRSFPYLGNTATVCFDQGNFKELARNIVYQAARETLRAMHNRATLALSRKENEHILQTAPEPATIAWRKDRHFQYPDPPLCQTELALLKQLRPDAEFSTPLSKLKQHELPNHLSAVAVSISDSAQLKRYGFTRLHAETLIEEIHLYLLVVGLQIAYGGSLLGDFKNPNSNFTRLMFDLVDAYSELAQRIDNETSLKPILNYPPWPLHQGYGPAEFRLFGEVAELIKGPEPDPAEVPESLEKIFPVPEDPQQFRFKSETPAQRLAWARGLTGMRAMLTEQTGARIVIGGKLDQFSGIYPGIVEEAWMSLSRKQPLYLVGVFGGAARAVIEALEGDLSALRSAIQSASGITETIDLANVRSMTIDHTAQKHRQQLHHTGLLIHPETLIEEIGLYSESGLENALNNGLSDIENRELFCTAHPPRIAELILTGLSRLNR